MKYFNNCKSIEDVKKLYKKLCKQYHPDLNKDDTTEIMKQINAEYETAFERFKNIHESADDNTKTYTSKETTETAAEFMVIINKLVVLEGVNVELIGRWIWLSGNTFPHKDILKGLGFRFARKKNAGIGTKQRMQAVTTKK